jgi:glycerophosphoryl diester phosphodiesterase
MRKAQALIARPIAHRGLHDAAKGVIENTPSAARAAISAGFGIECDVQISADGEAMVFHDFTLERLTQSHGSVDRLTAAELSRVAFQQTSDPMLPLGGLLNLVDGAVPLIVEVKSAFDGDMRLTERVIGLCAAYHGPIGFKSFDPRIVAHLRNRAPALLRGIVAMLDYAYPDYAMLDAAEKHALANLLHFDETKPDFLSWRVRDLPCAAPYLCRTQLALPVMTWTVRTTRDLALAKAHADQMVFEGFIPQT